MKSKSDTSLKTDLANLKIITKNDFFFCLPLPASSRASKRPAASSTAQTSLAPLKRPAMAPTPACLSTAPTTPIAVNGWAPPDLPEISWFPASPESAF